MATDNDQSNRGWVEHWARVGPELARIRREELRRYRHEDNIEIIDSLLELGLRHAQPRTTSGLVELQRLLHQGRGAEAAPDAVPEIQKSRRCEDLDAS